MYGVDVDSGRIGKIKTSGKLTWRGICPGKHVKKISMQTEKKIWKYIN